MLKTGGDRPILTDLLFFMKGGEGNMKGWIALLLTAALLCQLEPVYAVLHQNLP